MSLWYTGGATFANNVIINSSGVSGNTASNNGKSAIYGDGHTGGGLYTLSGTITLNNALSSLGAHSSGNSLTITGQVTGSGGLAISQSVGWNTGLVTLSNATNNYSGVTNITSLSDLRLGVNNALPSNTALTIASGRQLDLAGFNVSIGSLAGAGTVTKSSAGTHTLTTGGDNTSTTFSGIIQNGSGTTALTKSGTGTLTLSGANTYTGNTTLNAGTLTLGASNVLSDSTAVSVTAGTFNFNNFTDTVASFTTNSGSVTSFGTGSLITTGAQSFGGQVTGSTVSLTGSSITANNVLNDFTSTLTLSSTGAISIFDANALTIGAVSAGGNINFDAVTDITLT